MIKVLHRQLQRLAQRFWHDNPINADGLWSSLFYPVPRAVELLVTSRFKHKGIDAIRTIRTQSSSFRVNVSLANASPVHSPSFVDPIRNYRS